MIELDRNAKQPYPPKFEATRHPAGTIVRVTARRTRLTATYESNGACWRRMDLDELDTLANVDLSLDVANPQEG